MKNRSAILYIFLFAFAAFMGCNEQSFAQEAPKTIETPPPIYPFEETPPPVPEPKDQDLFFKEFLNMLATLGLIVMVLLLLSWYVKKMLNARVQQLNVSSLIKIIERRPLSPKAQVYIVEIHGKTLVLGESPTGLTKLTEYAGTIPDAEDQA